MPKTCTRIKLMSMNLDTKYLKAHILPWLLDYWLCAHSTGTFHGTDRREMSTIILNSKITVEIYNVPQTFANIDNIRHLWDPVHIDYRPNIFMQFQIYFFLCIVPHWFNSSN